MQIYIAMVKRLVAARYCYAAAVVAVADAYGLSNAQYHALRQLTAGLQSVAAPAA